MNYSVGKMRRLQHCATPDGKFVIMAVDHRGNLQQYLQDAHPAREIGYEAMRDFKLAVTAALQQTFSSVLLDPEFAAAQAIAAHQMPGSAGLIVSAEKWGYTGEATARETAVLPQWGVEKIARMGGDGVKMLLYYHPDSPTAAAQDAVVAQVVEACARHDIPFFLEPIVYSLNPGTRVLSSAEKRPLVIQAARHFTQMGIDILKAEFPLNIADEPDEAVWAEACAELTAASTVPWVLLSAGVGFTDYRRQAQVACANGCSGVMVGRAVWQEAIPLLGQERQRFLQETAVPRMHELAEICHQYGRPWTEMVTAGTAVGEDWYKTY